MYVVPQLTESRILDARGVQNKQMSSDPWSDPNYCWVVICKNAKAHHEENLMFGHKIPLAETDAFEVLSVTGPILVRCDACGHEDMYEPSDIARLEFTVPEGFQTHPRFQ